MKNAWLLGASIIVVIYAIWLMLLKLEMFSNWTTIILWISPLVGSTISSFFAPTKKIAIGMSMGVVTAISACVVNAIIQWTGGAVDFPGMVGATILFLVTVSYSLVLAAVGSAIGALIDKRERKDTYNGSC